MTSAPVKESKVTVPSRDAEPPRVAAGECTATHASCSENPKGSCVHEAGHSGSHKCGCGSSF